MRRLVLVFLDGVGVGPADAERNAFVGAEMPVLRNLLGGEPPTLATCPRVGERASLLGLDARLGVDGLPQSGTGQVSLLTGVNAAREYGRHFGPWVPASLRPLLRRRSLLAAARDAGLDVAFANAYPEEVIEAAACGHDSAARPPAAGTRRSRRAAQFLNAGPPQAALGAGLLRRHTSHLVRGDAVASEITNDGWRAYLNRPEVPPVDAEDAGRNLARIASAHHLTLFAHYSTDYAGHTGRLDVARTAIERVDAFLGGLIGAVPEDTLVVVASDHGNLEDCTAGHTRNPALALVVGQGHDHLSRDWVALTDVAASVLDVLGARPGGGSPEV